MRLLAPTPAKGPSSSIARFRPNGKAARKLLALAGACLLAKTASLAADPIIKAEVIGELAAGKNMNGNALITSADGKHYAFAGGDGSRQNVIIDGIEGPLFTQAGMQHVQTFNVREFPDAPDRPLQYSPVTSPVIFTGNGDEAVYIVNNSGTTNLVVAKDGTHREWVSLGQMQSASVSPKGKFIYAAYRVVDPQRPYGSGGIRLVVNEVASPEGVLPQSQGNAMAFYEPDNGKPAYAYLGREQSTVNNRIQDDNRVYFNGVGGPAFARIDTQTYPLRFTKVDDKLAIIYSGMKHGERFSRAVIQFADGKAILSENALAPNSLRISSTGNGVAWLETPAPSANAAPQPYNSGGTETVMVVLNGKEAFRYEAAPREVNNTARWFRLSDDGKRWSMARSLQGTTNFVWNMIVDGEFGPEYPSIERVNFTNNGEQHYYVTRNGRSSFVVLNGIEYGPYNQLSQIVSSDSGQSLAWFARTDYESGVYINGMLHANSESIGSNNLPFFRSGTEELVYLNTMDGQVELAVGDTRLSILGRHSASPVLSPDGKRAALTGNFNSIDDLEPSTFWVDGKPLQLGGYPIQSENDSWMGFTADSKHFVAFAGARNLTEQYRWAGTVVVDGYHLGPLFTHPLRLVGSPHITEDGKLCFYANLDREFYRYTIDIAKAAAFGKARAIAESKGGGKELFKLPADSGITQFDAVWLREAGTLYGVASGGEWGQGVLYRIDEDGSDFQVLHHFIGGGQNARQASSLAVSEDGNLYGTAGANSFSFEQPPVAGALFKIGKDGSGYEIVSKYPYDNKFRTSPLLKAVAPGGDLLAIGPVPNPGRSGTDGLLKISREDGSISTVYRANEYPENGQPIFKPLLPFIDGEDGFYYGWDQRNLYRFTLNGEAPTTIYSFKGFPLDGDSLREAPILFGDWLYGITGGGGKNRLGVVYRLKRDGSEYEVIRHIEKDKRFVALTSDESGVWAHRTEQAIVNNRQRNVPVIERLDIEDPSPRVLEKTYLSDRIWIGQFEGEKSLFALTSNSIVAVSLDEGATTVPELTIERIPMPPHRQGAAAQATF